MSGDVGCKYVGLRVFMSILSLSPKLFDCSSNYVFFIN